MENKYSDFKEKQNIIPLKIKNKENYYIDLLNLENSWTSRADAQIANAFIEESVQLIINSIRQFELGYFDASFYSLRQSLEVSTTMTYLIDNDEETRNKQLVKWKSQSNFPQYSQMLKLLEKNKSTFFDIKSKLVDYFEVLKETKHKLNKYIHKQGFNTFYITRYIQLYNQGTDDFITEYESYLNTCIGSIAILRLTIDPFPILLKNNDIYTRTEDLMTTAYSDNFIEKYIGFKHIDSYKQTDIYQNHYNAIISDEAKNEFVLDVVKNQYIDTENFDKIFEQKHLLNKYAIFSIIICSISDLISKVYYLGGAMYYHTNIQSCRTEMSWNSSVFLSFSSNTEKFNQQYDEVYISVIELLNESYFIEHNNKFNNNELSIFLKLEKKYLEK